MSDDTTCMIEGCKHTHKALGWCQSHYDRYRRYGDPNASKQRTNRPVDERFWEKVNAYGVCWEWEASKDSKGYGRFRVGGQNKYAHRVAWELLVGPITDGMELDHLCRNHSCCFPEHLEETTGAENKRRGYGVGTISARKTHCPKGHEYSAENTKVRITKTGGVNRQCITCERARSRRRYYSWRDSKVR